MRKFLLLIYLSSIGEACIAASSIPRIPAEKKTQIIATHSTVAMSSVSVFEQYLSVRSAKTPDHLAWSADLQKWYILKFSGPIISFGVNKNILIVQWKSKDTPPQHATYVLRKNHLYKKKEQRNYE